ncbi:hypothetical protein [Sphingomonas sp. 22176]|uniref:hypothetical protein n=1 Tax=Sphingomonas sp. 22176 TaxID=3453884 RepID=UPI003F82E98C
MRAIICLPAVLLSGCASVTFKQLNPDLSVRADAPEGAIYYMPKPYLMVAQLPLAEPAVVPPAVVPPAAVPAPPPKPKNAKKGDEAGGKDQWPSAFGNKPAPGGADEKPAASADGVALVAGTDQSFGGSSQGYIMKIVYLPDMRRPMSISMKSGFGTSSVKPTFQNGWMLTGFDASADSKTSELLTALAPLITAYKTPAKAGGDATGGGAGAAPQPGEKRPPLPPGLYEIQYDSNGVLKGICSKTLFTAQGPVPASDAGACR